MSCDGRSDDLCCQHLCADNVSSPFCSSFGGVTPMEIRYEIPLRNGTNVTVWMPTSITPSAPLHFHTDTCKAACNLSDLPRGCCSNYTRTAGYNMISVRHSV